MSNADSGHQSGHEPASREVERERERGAGRVVLDASGSQRASTRIAHEIVERVSDVSDMSVCRGLIGP